MASSASAARSPVVEMMDSWARDEHDEGTCDNESGNELPSEAEDGPPGIDLEGFAQAPEPNPRPGQAGDAADGQPSGAAEEVQPDPQVLHPQRLTPAK